MSKTKIDRKKHKINPFKIALASVELDFRELSLLADFIESTIRQELKNLEKWAADEENKNTPAQLDESHEIASEAYQLINQDFRLRLRYGLIVTIYTVIESRLNHACDICKSAINRSILEKHAGSEKDLVSNMRSRFFNQKEILLDYTDLKDKGIKRASTYLQKVLKLSFPRKDRGIWQDIKTLANIRHCIVHTDGFDEEKKVASFVKKHPDYVKYSEKNQIEIEAEYCTWIIGQAKDFFTEFYSSNMDLFEE